MTPPSYVVFLAFPYDAATMPMYRRIARKLSAAYSGRFRFVVGTDEVIPPSPRDLTIQTFRRQNNDLLKQFRDNVRASDIIVADLTNNNPNVHVELGIALALNKNIVRVSSRNVVEVGSDVKGYVVKPYRSEKDLTTLLRNYLDTFLEIKNLPFSLDAGPFYSVDRTSITLRKGASRIVGAMRDGAVRVQFKFTAADSADAWFGIYFRSGSAALFTGGYLLYVRQNGSLELAELPNVRILESANCGAAEIGSDHTLEVSVDGGVMSASVDGSARFECEGLNVQSYGNVSVGCWKSEVIVTTVEMVSRDAIEFG